MFQNSILGIAFDAALEQLKEEENLALAEYQQHRKKKGRHTMQDDDVDKVDDKEDDDDDDFEAHQQILDNVFARFDNSFRSSSSSSTPTSNNNSDRTFTQEQKEKLELVFAEAMVEALSLTTSSSNHSMTSSRTYSTFPKNDIVIRAPALGATIASSKKTTTTTTTTKNAGSSSSSNKHKNKHKKSKNNDDDDENEDGNEADDDNSEHDDYNYFPIYRKDAQNNWTIILKDPQVFIRGPAVTKAENEEQQKHAAGSLVSSSSSSSCSSATSALTNLMIPIAEAEARSKKGKDINPMLNTTLPFKTARQLECDYAVLQVRELPLVKKTVPGPVRRARV